MSKVHPDHSYYRVVTYHLCETCLCVRTFFRMKMFQSAHALYKNALNIAYIYKLLAQNQYIYAYILFVYPASKQSRATIGPPMKRHSIRFAGGPIVAHFYMHTGYRV